ncbi:MAG TPA: zf-HC2 domain-containing protein [Acidobacteriota bacterium]|nr:zf-HC2 domain-containing protein [Acidobacteriota bacterium]
MNCRSVESHFSDFLDDALSQAERRSFEAHLLGCRRCSHSLREMKSALALLGDAAKATVVETSPHFEDDLMDRIRSGEAMRPTVIEWLRGFLEPARLRPVFMTGAAACALALAVLFVNRGDPNAPGTGPIASSSQAPSVTAPAGNATPAAEATVTPEPVVVASSAPARPSRRAPADATPSLTGADAPNGVLEIVDRAAPGQGTELESALPNPNALFTDEYVTDQFLLQRGRAAGGAQQPSAVPVTDRGSDDVYIEF